MMEDDTESMCVELVDLPDVILVRVMSFLPISDRYSLLQTCQRLHDVFNHPSLWYRLKIDPLYGNYSANRAHQLQNYANMINKVGHCCQELELNYLGTYCKMDDEVREFILKLSETCRLETLVVSFEYNNLKHKPRSNFIGPAVREDIEVLCSIVSRSHRLTSFCIRQWPIFNHSDPSQNEILDALCENKKLDKLEKLHLFWPDRSETTWAAVRCNQTPEYALKVVDHFKDLTYLSLMSNTMSEKLLKVLASPGRRRLENLRIMVVYKSDIPVNGFSDQAWSRLRPQLKVEVVFSSRVPSDAMFTLLTPSVPVHKLHFMKYSRCTAEDLSRIGSLYYQTLEKFVDETDSENSKSLLKLAHVCDNLRSLVYHGKISYVDVMELARVRGRDWYEFVVMEGGVEYEEGVGGDDDQVLRKDERGEYYQVAVHRWGDTDQSLAEKEDRRTKMISCVEKELGYRWEPRS